MIVNVIPETKTVGENTTFSYIVPEKLEADIRIGSIVVIPFGKRTMRGVVSGTESRIMNHESCEIQEKKKFRLKQVISVEQNFSLPPKYLEIARWISEYYLCALGEAVSLFLPPVMKRPRATDESGIRNQESGENKIITLTAEQKIIFEQLKARLTNKIKKPALIHGVTGSGKTEIYIKLAEEILKIGKKVVVLVPEIILTPQIVERFREIFPGKITLMHSNLSKSERFLCYMDFISGKKPIVIGPRSALLVPDENIGLIIVDEEQDDSYKQDQNPRYHAVDLACKISLTLNASLVLGSATPRVESFYRAKEGEYDLFILDNRYAKEEMPESVVIDLRDEIRAGNYSPISETLRREIKEKLERKKQILLFLNRRGSATFVSCRDCGHVILCKNCSIPMVYHVNQNSNFLSCHHCDYKLGLPDLCPACGSTRIKYFGVGVEKIRAEIERLFPAARTVVVDSTSMTKKDDYASFYKKLSNKEYDIIIGTQMIARGFDIPSIDLVGIVSADTGLHMPHYRAAERSFELLTQVSGRSGRGKDIGKTVIQSYWPETLAVSAAKEHDYALFYNNEIKARKEYDYPPFTHLVRVISEDSDESKARKRIEQIARDLGEKKLCFIGPSACFYSRLRGNYRFHLIIKTKTYPDARIAEIAKQYKELLFDVDPTNLL